MATRGQFSVEAHTYISKVLDMVLALVHVDKLQEVFDLMDYITVAVKRSVWLHYCTKKAPKLIVLRNNEYDVKEVKNQTL